VRLVRDKLAHEKRQIDRFELEALAEDGVRLGGVALDAVDGVEVTYLEVVWSDEQALPAGGFLGGCHGSSSWATASLVRLRFAATPMDGADSKQTGSPRLVPCGRGGRNGRLIGGLAPDGMSYNDGCHYNAAVITQAVSPLL
jgi:hypothetical protein